MQKNSPLRGGSPMQLGGFFVFLSLFLFSCEEKKKDTTSIMYQGPSLEMDNLEVIYSDSARLKVKMTTAKQLRLQNEDQLYPKPIFISFYDKTGIISTTIRGDSGRYSQAQSTYKVMGNVFVLNQLKHESLSTEVLNWNPQSKKIYTDKAVTVQNPDEHIKGIGLDAEQDFSRYSLRQVTGIFAVKE